MPLLGVVLCINVISIIQNDFFMKMTTCFTALVATVLTATTVNAQKQATDTAQVTHSSVPGNKALPENLYMDVHHFGPGKVNAAAVAEAHAKDLAAEGNYGVHFLKYWVDEQKGLVYCLSTAPDSAAIVNTHAKAHGMLPENVYLVTDGKQAKVKGNNNFFLDVHELGSVSATDVAAAHKKDLATEKKYGVNFINYWVNEKQGVVMCLSQAPDSSAVINTHKEAHGLLPTYIGKVQQSH